MLLSSLRLHGPQLEEYSKSTLDQGTLHSFFFRYQAQLNPGHNFIQFKQHFSAYVKFRNASQDERLSIITRMNLLELIELRAKSWQVSDGLNTYYKHKVSDVQVNFALSHSQRTHHEFGLESTKTFLYFFFKSEGTAAASMLQNLTLLDTSPSTQSPPVLNAGEVIRVSGKFTKPTKIPGKNYTKDEVVIRNADSGKGTLLSFKSYGISHSGELINY